MLLALRLIHQHEIFDSAMDYASAQLELLSGRPCWAPARSLKNPKGYNVREEKLANAWMIRSLWRGTTRLNFKGRSEAVRKFVAAMPEGYRDAHDVGRPDFFPEVDVLVSDYARAAGGFDPLLMRQLDGARLLPFAPAIDWRECPIHIIHDEKRLNLPPFEIDLLRVIAQVAQTEGFKRELARLDPRIQKLWPGTERKLLLDVTIPGLDFKHFDHNGERVYSVRLNKAYRAHLRKKSAPPGWEVFSVGDHKTMGHS